MTGEKKREYTLKISTANRTELIVILYEIFLDYLEEAKEAHAKEDLEEFRISVKKAKSCNLELMNSLNFSYEITGNLLQLYRYVNRELTRAAIRVHIEPVENAERVIKELCEAYKEISVQDTSPPIMENTQTVYAGLTYGRDNLVENLSDQGIDRGFRI